MDTKVTTNNRRVYETEYSWNAKSLTITSRQPIHMRGK